MSFNRITDLTDVMEASIGLSSALECKLIETRAQ